MEQTPTYTPKQLSEIASLRQAVETQHGRLATLRAIARVTEPSEGEAVWVGTVAVFNLIDHPTAEIAYVWCDPVPGSDRRRFYAVLHAGPVDSPEKAVKAAMLSE